MQTLVRSWELLFDAPSSSSLLLTSYTVHYIQNLKLSQQLWRNHYQPTAGPTEQPTDGRTDKASYIDARAHLKMKNIVPRCQSTRSSGQWGILKSIRFILRRWIIHPLIDMQGRIPTVEKEAQVHILFQFLVTKSIHYIVNSRLQMYHSSIQKLEIATGGPLKCSSLKLESMHFSRWENSRNCRHCSEGFEGIGDHRGASLPE